MEEYKVPKEIVSMIRYLYEGFKCCVVHKGKLTDSFEVTTGVRQGFILPPPLLHLVLDSVLNKVIKGRKRGLQWRMRERLEGLDFADDICLLAQRWSDIKAKLEKLDIEAAKVGLKINGFKTKGMRVNPSTDLALTVNGREVEQVKSFTYLGSTVTTDGTALEDIQS
jgi:hypothetical protein